MHKKKSGTGSALLAFQLRRLTLTGRTASLCESDFNCNQSWSWNPADKHATTSTPSKELSTLRTAPLLLVRFYSVCLPPRHPASLIDFSGLFLKEWGAQCPVSPLESFNPPRQHRATPTHTRWSTVQQLTLLQSHLWPRRWCFYLQHWTIAATVPCFAR